MGLNDCLKSYLLIPPLVRLQSFLVRKVLLLLVTTFQDYYYFKPCLNIKNHTCIHCTQRAQAKTMPSVHTSSQFYIPSGKFPVSNCNFNGHVALHAHVNSVTPDLRQCSSTHINYNIVRNSRGPYRPKLTVKN